MLEGNDLHWAAGLMEGEGYFGVRRSNRDLVVQVGMTDGDVIQRLQAALGCGAIKTRTLKSEKKFYTLTISRQAEAKLVMESVLPLMGERRAAQIRYCLAQRATVPLPRREWTHCSHGHELSGPNLRIVKDGCYSKRRCVQCAKERQRQYRDRKAA